MYSWIYLKNEFKGNILNFNRVFYIMVNAPAKTCNVANFSLSFSYKIILTIKIKLTLNLTDKNIEKRNTYVVIKKNIFLLIYLKSIEHFSLYC